MAGCAGIVLAGGRSSRMGASKAALEWHGSTLLRRTVSILARATSGPVVVVRARGQVLPDLPPGVILAEDPREGKGPVQGIAAGLAAVAGVTGVTGVTGVAGLVEAAFVCATDMPFLHPAFVRRVLRAVGDGADIALPVARGYPQPLAAAYRTSLADVAERLVATGQLRPSFLFAECAVARLDEEALREDPVLAALDPDLDSLLNVNTPDEYAAARVRQPPEVTAVVSGVAISGVSPSGAARPRAVRAATVAAAAAAVGLDGPGTAIINGGVLAADGQEPLAAGDSVAFIGG